MASDDAFDPDLPDSQHALGEYLQALLDEVEDYAESDAEAGEPGAGEQDATSPGAPSDPAEPQEAPGTGPGSAGDDAPEPARESRESGPAARRTRVEERPRLPQAPLPEVAPDDPPAPAPESPTPPAPPQEAAEAASPSLQGTGAPPAQPPEDPTPAWARPFFQALTIHVGALRLAVPLVKLHRVVPWDDPEAVQPAVGQPEWMHGLLDHRGRYISVVDTAELVLPPERRPEPEERRHGKIIIVGDGTWGLACRDVGDVLKLRPEQVQWRGSASRRRWLAGTVREHLCALVDTDAFAAMLAEEGGVGGTLATGAAAGQNTAGSRSST